MTTPDVCDPWGPLTLCCELPEDLDQAVIDRWHAVASQILFRLSGRRHGPSCPVSVRPCRRSCMDQYPAGMFGWATAGPWIPYIGTDGAWRNASVCGCTSDCSCGELCEIRLEGPVFDIVSVQEDAVILPATAYRVDNPNLLVRLDGACWPTCQDMAAAPGEPDTLTVTYRTGLALDESALAAVSELTCHLIKGCVPGSCGCNANPYVTRRTRQGVEIETPDASLVYSEGRTGLPIADLWLATVNPYRQPSPSRVFSVDYRTPRRQQWP